MKNSEFMNILHIFIYRMKVRYLFLALLMVVVSLPQVGLRAQNGTRAQGCRLVDKAAAISGSRMPVTRLQDGNLNVIRSKGTVCKLAANRKPIATTDSGVELWGSIVYADSWAEAYWSGGYVPFGYYAFPASAASGFEELALDDLLQADGGAVIIGDTLHVVHDVYGYGSHGIVYSEFDTRNWQLISTRTMTDYGLSAFDLAYDPTTGKVFGEFCSTDSDVPGFGTIDYKTLTKSVVPMDTVFVGLACNSRGQLYGINVDGCLYTIDKETGHYDKVGALGIVPSNYRQSATFDLRTDRLYYAAQTADNASGLYEIDTETGWAKLICAFDDNEEVCGLYVPDRGSNGLSPAKVDDLSIEFVGGELTGTVSFTSPKTDASGTVIRGELACYVVANGDTIAEGYTQAGQACAIPVRVAAAGSYRFEVFTGNDYGLALPVRMSKDWIGYDVPVLSDAVLTIDKVTREAALGWSVAGGAHGGYVDEDGLTFRIVRFPGGVTVADGHGGLTFGETLPEGELCLYRYAVIADNHGTAGDTLWSAERALGDHCSVPYRESFNTTGAVDECFTVVDSNGDGTSWRWTATDGGAAEYNSGTTTVYGDDWLLTPDIVMEPGRRYMLEFRASGSEGHRIQVKFGEGGDPTDRDKYKVLVKTTELGGTGYTVFRQGVEVARAGRYRFAFHATSGPNRGSMLIDDIAVEPGVAYGAPAMVSELTATAAPQGELQATVSFTLPVSSIEGNTLTELERAEVYRNGERIGEVTDVTVGGTASYVDNAPVNGFNTYMVVPYNGMGVGEPDSVKVYVGQDVPLAVGNVRLVDNLDGTATLAWDAPVSTGVNGGYVGADLLDYDIYYAGYTMLGPDATVHAVCNMPVELRVDGLQSMVYYTVVPRNVAGEGSAAVSTALVEGAVYGLPFGESFPSGNYETIWWRDNATSDNSFRYNLGVSSDNDNGSIYWVPSNGETQGQVNTGKIDLRGADNPMLAFDFYGVPGFDGRLQVVADSELKGGDVVLDIDYKLLTGEQGWQRTMVPLRDYKDAEYVVLKFIAQATDTDGRGIFIDNVTVRDVAGHDLAVDMATPKRVRKGVMAYVPVTVSNTGSNDEDDFAVRLYENGLLVAECDGGTLVKGADSLYVLTYVPAQSEKKYAELTVVAELTTDANPDDNTDWGMVMLDKSTYQVPRDLTADASAADGSVTLSWREPLDGANRITDDMESYASWLINGIGGWTVVDGDRKPSYGLTGHDFPRSGQPYAFIVFNPVELGADVETDEAATFKAHSGEQYLACFDAVGGSNDDWLISPELSGEAQTISFYAKNIATIPGQYVEELEVLYSTGGTSAADFRSLTASPVKATDAWTEYSYDLPEQARRFAIRVVSDDQFALLVDDISYDGVKPVLTGYNIYRDGELFASTGAATREFTDPDGNGHDYFVTARYDIGESGASNKASQTSAVTTIATGQARPVKVYSATGIESGAQKGVRILKYSDGTVRKEVRK